MHRKAANSFERSTRRLLSNSIQFFVQLLNRKTVLILTLLFIAGVSGALWNMSRLSSSLIQSQALQSAALYAQAIEEARTLYSSEAVRRVAGVPGITVTYDYTDTPGAIPVPATYLIELSHHLSDKNPGMSVRLYSDYPFPWRKAEGGPKDAFEREALRHLTQHPEQPFYRIETFQGRPALRYAQADIMQASCVSCHNSDPNSPKRDWRVGDVRGALAITRPLDTFMAQTNAGLRGTFLMLSTLSLLALSGIALVIGRLRQTSKELELRVIERTAQLQSANQELATEQGKSERLLLNILPPPIAQKLKDGQSNIADGFASATILFADLVNFTQLAEQVPPTELVAMLNEIFSAFDRLSEQYELEKIKTIGDAYMVVGGLPTIRPDHPQAIAEMALAMREEIHKFNLRYHQSCSLRIGINTGPVVAGVIGTKKFIYDLWGDTVNIASRMESHGLPGAIQVTAATYECLQDDYTFEPRGSIQVKGKGEITAYLLIGKKSQPGACLTPVSVA
jgi:class 3 adenylate cyclase